jgi:hypothetical protein
MRFCMRKTFRRIDLQANMTQIYDLGIMDYGGPVGRCADLDAGWWN